MVRQNNIPDIVTWAESPAEFYIPETREPIKLADHQGEILRHIFTPQDDGRLAYDTIVYSCPKKSGKTTIAALVAEYFGLFFEAPNEIYLCANDFEQSIGRVYKNLSQSVRLNGLLSSRTDVQAHSCRFDNGTNIDAIASDYAGAAGSNHGLTIWDELWAYTSESARRLWDELTPVPTRKISIRFIATYAGFESESELLQELYAKGMAGEVVPQLAHIEDGEGKSACRANGRTFIYWDHELKPYPGLTISPEVYHAEQRASLRPLAYLRLHENRFTANEDIFITAEQWQACYDAELQAFGIGDDRSMILGADASTSRDLTALVGVHNNEETHTREVIYCRVWKPEKGEYRFGKPTVDLDETIKAEILRLHDEVRLLGVYFDPYQLHSIALELEKAGVKMYELPQTNARIEADQSLYDAIIGKTIRHYGDTALNEHVRNAVAISTPRGFRLAKEKTSRKIDAAVALSMAHYGALKEAANPTWYFVV
jgi:phage terminase large subunit-like protein